METIETYLFNLRNKVFKLLPMREARDKGDENHLDEYLVNLSSGLAGAFDCFPSLASEREIVEVQASIAYLKCTPEVSFREWRSTVLRSARLISRVLDRCIKEV